jgi:hypothetical protein
VPEDIPKSRELVEKLEEEILSAVSKPEVCNLGVLKLGLEAKIKLLADILREQEKGKSQE